MNVLVRIPGVVGYMSVDPHICSQLVHWELASVFSRDGHDGATTQLDPNPTLVYAQTLQNPAADQLCVDVEVRCLAVTSRLEVCGA